MCNSLTLINFFASVFFVFESDAQFHNVNGKEKKRAHERSVEKKKAFDSLRVLFCLLISNLFAVMLLSWQTEHFLGASKQKQKNKKTNEWNMNYFRNFQDFSKLRKHSIPCHCYSFFRANFLLAHTSPLEISSEKMQTNNFKAKRMKWEK